MRARALWRAAQLVLASIFQASRSRGLWLSQSLRAEPGVTARAHTGNGLSRASRAGSMCRAPGKLLEDPQWGAWGPVTTSLHFWTGVHSEIIQLLEEGDGLLRVSLSLQRNLRPGRLDRAPR